MAEWQIYRDAGVAALFILLYVTTLKMFITDLKEQRKQGIENTEKVIKALETSSTAMANSTFVLREAKSSIEQNTRQTAEFVAYIKGRDAG